MKKTKVAMENPVPKERKEFICESLFDSGMCCDCRYFCHWQGEPWCDKSNTEVREPTRIKGCYTR